MICPKDPSSFNTHIFLFIHYSQWYLHLFFPVTVKTILSTVVSVSHMSILVVCKFTEKVVLPLILTKSRDFWGREKKKGNKYWQTGLDYTVVLHEMTVYTRETDATVWNPEHIVFTFMTFRLTQVCSYLRKND